MRFVVLCFRYLRKEVKGDTQSSCITQLIVHLVEGKFAMNLNPLLTVEDSHLVEDSHKLVVAVGSLVHKELMDFAKERGISVSAAFRILVADGVERKKQCRS